MGMRFRRSIRIAPGVRMNLSGSGASFSIGPRGASVNFGKRGTYLNAGIPGTGLYSRQKISSTSRSSKSSGIGSSSVRITLNDSGEIRYTDADGNPLSDRYIRELKKQAGDKIQEMVEQGCEKINAETESLGKIHLYTDPPEPSPRYTPESFDIPEPTVPALKKPGILGWLFKFVKARVERINAMKMEEFAQEKSEWERERREFIVREETRKELIEQGIYNNTNDMEEFFGSRLQEIAWPRETLISFEFQEGGKTIYLDVDLPEIEDMPNKEAKVIQRGMKLSVKDVSETNLRKLYMNHVHAIGFRVVGEAFSSLPILTEAVISAYSQRMNNATGYIDDEYLYSAKITRSDWSSINFRNLEAINVVDAFGQFDLRRNMTKTGVFKVIEPFQPKS